MQKLKAAVSLGNDTDYCPRNILPDSPAFGTAIALYLAGYAMNAPN